MLIDRGFCRSETSDFLLGYIYFLLLLFLIKRLYLFEDRERSQGGPEKLKRGRAPSETLIRGLIPSFFLARKRRTYTRRRIDRKRLRKIYLFFSVRTVPSHPHLRQRLLGAHHTRSSTQETLPPPYLEQVAGPWTHSSPL